MNFLIYFNFAVTLLVARVNCLGCTGLNLAFFEECRYCRCNAAGQETKCHDLPCLPGRVGLVPNPCAQKVLEKFFDGCNWCKCNTSTGDIEGCTKKQCPPEPFPCMPGKASTFWESCNLCHCNEDGTIGDCTTNECDDEPRRSCAPGETMRKDCNLCHCIEGKFVCTLMECIKGVNF